MGNTGPESRVPGAASAAGGAGLSPAGAAGGEGVRVTTWKGRAEGRVDPDVWEFLRADDAELLPYDCEATAEHARRLADAGILTAD